MMWFQHSSSDDLSKSTSLSRQQGRLGKWSRFRSNYH